MAKKVKFGFGKRRKRTKAGDEHRTPGCHRRERNPGEQKSDDGDNNRMAVALLCAAAGLPVVPLHGLRNGSCTCGNEHCEQPGQHPRTKDATTNRALIKKYWTKWPKAKIGIVMGGKSGVIALVTEGTAGKKTLRDLEEKTE